MAEAVKIKGLRELARKLKQMPVELRGKTLNAALRKGAKEIASEAQRRVPVRDGVLQRSIVIRKARVINPNNEASQTVSVRKNAKSGGNPYYASFVEFGTSKMPARPFMRPAFESRNGDALAVFKTELSKRIERFARRKV